MVMTINSVDEAIEVIEILDARGTIEEVDYQLIRVRVQRWKIDLVRIALHEMVPLSVKVRVEPLTFWEHFTVWGVTRLQ